MIRTSERHVLVSRFIKHCPPNNQPTLPYAHPPCLNRVLGTNKPIIRTLQVLVSALTRIDSSLKLVERKNKIFGFSFSTPYCPDFLVNTVPSFLQQPVCQALCNLPICPSIQTPAPSTDQTLYLSVYNIPSCQNALSLSPPHIFVSVLVNSYGKLRVKSRLGLDFTSQLTKKKV